MSEYVPDVPLEQVATPNRSEKLHPYEKEDEDDWEAFRNSVGDEPDKPLTVIENGDGYILVDGDRRMRALNENGAETVSVLVDDSVTDSKTLYTKRLTANEHRLENDPKQRSWYIAQMCAPWLLPPGERRDDVDPMTQTEVGEAIGHRQGVISRWLMPMKAEYPLRAALANKVGTRPTEEDIKLIDETIDHLKGDSMVVSMGQENFAAEELDDMDGVNLSEIHTTAKKASEQGWSIETFLEHIEKNYAIDPVKKLEEDEDVQMGVGIPGTSGFQDSSGADDGDETSDEWESETEDEPDPEEQFRDEFSAIIPDVPNVDWESRVSDADLNGDSISDIEQQMMITQTIQDDAAVALNILGSKYDISHDTLMRQFVEPLIVDRVLAGLQE